MSLTLSEPVYKINCPACSKDNLYSISAMLFTPLGHNTKSCGKFPCLETGRYFIPGGHVRSALLDIQLSECGIQEVKNAR